MSNGNTPAMPIIEESKSEQYNGGTYTTATAISLGLTKREEFAARFMAAWIIHHGSSGDYGYSSQSAAQCAIQDADALLAELERAK